MFKRRFKIRLSLKIAAGVAVFFGGLYFIVTPLAVRTIANQARRSLVSQTTAYTILATQPIGDAFIQYRDSGTTLLNERITSTANLNTAILNITIYDVETNELFRLRETRPAITRADAEAFTPIFRYDDEGFLQEVVYPYIEESGAHRFTLVYDVSSSEIKTQLTMINNSILVASTAILLAAILVSVLLIEFLLVRPLKEMSRLAAVISAGQYDARVSLKRRDEIRDLGDALNQMAEKLKADIEALKRAEKLKSEFLIISSHNLRTPMTVITGYLDLLKDMPLDETAQKYITTIQSHANELTNLTNDMLTIAELEGGAQPKLSLETVDVKALLEELVPEIEKRLASKAQTLLVKLPDQAIQLATQTTYLKTALWNLVDNAHKFTDEKGEIRLTLRQSDGQVRISVSDTGIGISQEELGQLFTKFHRGTSVMQYDYEGVGLGLYMTKLMIELLGGSIEAASTLGAGSTFTLVLSQTSNI